MSAPEENSSRARTAMAFSASSGRDLDFICFEERGNVEFVPDVRARHGNGMIRHTVVLER